MNSLIYDAGTSERDFAEAILAGVTRYTSTQIQARISGGDLEFQFSAIVDFPGRVSVKGIFGYSGAIVKSSLDERGDAIRERIGKGRFNRNCLDTIISELGNHNLKIAINPQLPNSDAAPEDSYELNISWQ